MSKLCVGCNRQLPLAEFGKAPPDFPTRDGRLYKCKDCAPAQRILRRTESGKVELIR